MRMSERDEELEQADWVGDDLDETRGAWRGHLGRQAQRMAVAVLVVVMLSVIRLGGRPGNWVLTQMRHAMEADFAPLLNQVAAAPRWQSLAASLRAWLAREWQVTGESMTRTGTAGAPPSLVWPVSGDYRLARMPGGGYGLNLQVRAGTPVLAAAAGMVQEVRSGSAGFSLVLTHADGWQTIYGNCQGVLAAKGEQVRAGQTIALVGSAPPPTPSHLRFEVWSPEGEVDPLPFLTERANHVRI